MDSKYFHECFIYDNSTGSLVWRERPEYHFKSAFAMSSFNSRFSGRVAGWVNNDGYVSVRVAGATHLAHRLICKFINLVDIGGCEADHIDGCRGNNVASNLRVVTKHQNLKNKSIYKNSKSGISGVSWYKSVSKWRVRIKVNGKAISVGYFDDIDSAIKARDDSKIKYGFHENHGTRKL